MLGHFLWLVVCVAISGCSEINFNILVVTYLPKVRFPENHRGRNEDRRNTAKPWHLRPEPSLVNARGVNQQEFHFHQGNYAGDTLSVRGDSGVSPFSSASFICFCERRPQSFREPCSAFGYRRAQGRETGEAAQSSHRLRLCCVYRSFRIRV